MHVIRIATRNSPLALCQSNWVANELKNHHANLKIELVPMTTEGDQLLAFSLAKIGGKGLFVKELEKALLENRADIAVHSMKDVPVEFPQGLELSAICAREDVRDVFVSNHFQQIKDLPLNAKIGTSSLRRQALLKAHRPDLEIIPLRGNVQTRLNKMVTQSLDGIILAAAGLHRLQENQLIKEYINTDLLLPAIGQAALGIEVRENDANIQDYLKPLICERTTICIKAERALNRYLHGGCQVPIGGLAALDQSGKHLLLRGLVADPDGSQIIQGEISGLSLDAENLGEQLAKDLLAKGAGKILEKVYAERE